MENQENTRTRKYLRGFKIATGILCIVGFCCNSFIIFKQFIGKKTVTSQNIEENVELILPSITMCGISGFKDIVDEYADLEFDKYANNTINLNEVLVELNDNDNHTLKAEALLGTIFDKSRSWRISTTYSAYRGRCYTVEYRRKVNEIYSVAG